MRRKNRRCKNVTQIICKSSNGEKFDAGQFVRKKEVKTLDKIKQRCIIFEMQQSV